MGKIIKFSYKAKNSRCDPLEYEIRIKILQNDFKDEDLLQHYYFIENFKIYLKSCRESDYLYNLTEFRLRKYLIFLHNFKIEDYI